MTEEDKSNTIEVEPEPFEPVRHYTAVSESFKLDWNMLMYKIEDDDGFQLDWNKLIYNEEQLEEFNQQKREKFVRPEFLDYLIKPIGERSAMEKFFLEQSGFCAGDENDETDAEYDKMTAVDAVRSC